MQLFQSWIENGRFNRVYIWWWYHSVTVETPLQIWATATVYLDHHVHVFEKGDSSTLKEAFLWNVSKSLVLYGWGFIRDPTGGFTTLLCKDTWNLVLVHLRKIPRSAGRKYRFSLPLYTKMHGFKYEFSNIFWGGAHRARPPQSQTSPSILGRFASSVWAAPLIHPSNMFNNLSPNRVLLDQILFSPNSNFLATPLDPIYRSKIRYVVWLIEIYQW